MMKRFLPLISLAVVSQATLRGSGVEEVGDQIWFEPEPDVVVERTYFSRRTEEAESNDFDKLDFSIESLEDDEDDREIEVFELDGPFLFELNEGERRETECGSGKSFVQMKVKTDNRPEEISWKLLNSNNQQLLSGPGNGKTYSARTVYSGGKCLGPGKYTMRVIDEGGDGNCCERGNGFVKVFVDGTLVAKATGDADWKRKNLSFTIAPGSGRNNLPISSGGGGSTSTSSVGSNKYIPSTYVTKNCYNTKLALTVDKFGEETTVTVRKGHSGSGASVMEIPPVVQAYGSKNVMACLPRGDYTLTITDFDGICCRNGNGKLDLSIEGQEILTAGSFVKEITFEFKVGYDWKATMSQRDEDYLVAHNKRRAKWHVEYGKKYRPLRWSQGLKKNAQEYANRLLSTCEDNGIKHMPGLKEGENLAKNRGYGGFGQLYDADLIVARFIDREVGWAWNSNAHLTQGLWYAAKYVGCADSVLDMGGGKMCRMQVCRYAKAGNCQMGQYDSGTGDNWKIPMMKDDTPCGPVCPRDGCFAE